MKIALISSFQTESELQELIREVEENPAPPDAPQPPTPKTGDTEGGKEITGFTFVCLATYNRRQNYHISSDNSREQLFEGRRLFQILLTGSCAVNICSIIPLNQKIIASNKLNIHGLFKCS